MCCRDWWVPKKATETIKLILDVGESSGGRLLLIDALSMPFRSMRIKKDPECPACGTPTTAAPFDYDEFGGVRALGSVPTAMNSLDESRRIVVMCRSGKRSLDATKQLKAAGFARVENLAGGILR